MARIAFFGVAALLGGCSWIFGAGFLTVSPGPQEFRAILAEVAPLSGFVANECAPDSDGRERVYCATFASVSGSRPMDLFGSLQPDGYHVSLGRLNGRLSAEEQAGLLAIVKELSRRGVVLCLDRKYRKSGLPRDLTKDLKANCQLGTE